jgi:hypothetical protein
MSTDKILRAHDLPSEARKLAAETKALFAEVQARGFTVPLRLRAKDLRKRSQALSTTFGRVLELDAATAIAFRERVGRNLEDGDLILPEDDARAAEIVRALESKAGQC